MISIVRLVANAVKASLAILKHTQKFYPISTQLRIEKRQNREIGTSRYSEMVAVDAIGVCFQSTSKFPSWTSRVRSPSPALSKQELTDSAKPRVLQNTPLSILDRLLQLI